MKIVEMYVILLLFICYTDMRLQTLAQLQLSNVIACALGFLLKHIPYVVAHKIQVCVCISL